MIERQGSVNTKIETDEESCEFRFKFYLGALVLAAFLLRVVFIFSGTDYAHYLSSDMGGYWQRAHERLSGNEFSVNQFAIWPPFFHIVLSVVLRGLDVLGFKHYDLEVALGLSAFLGALAVWFMGAIAFKAFGSSRLALAVASLYAVSYPLIYFSAFILSENFSIPLSIASVYFLLRGDVKGSLISGLLLGLSAGARPPYAVWAIPFFLYLLLGERSEGRTKAGKPLALGFALAFVVCVSLICLENRRISLGRISGLSANGALGLYIGIVQPYSIESISEGFRYIIIPPQSTPYPERYRLKTFHPMYDQGYFLGLTAKFIAEHPSVVIMQMPTQIGNLFLSPLFPGMGSAWGFRFLFPVWRFIMIAVVGLSVLYPFFQINRSRSGWLFYSMMMFMLVLHCIFPSEHRYAYGFYFVAVLLCAHILHQAFKSRAQLRQVVSVYILGIFLLLCAYFGPHIYRAMYVEKVIRADITKNATDIKHLDQLPEISSRSTAYFETIAIRPQGEFGYKNHPSIRGLNTDFFITFRVRAEVLRAGNYRFGFYLDDGFRFLVDGKVVAEKPGEGDFFSVGKIGQVYLTEGHHDFELKYYQGGGNMSCVASYQLIRPGEEPRLIGDSSDNISFRRIPSDT